MYTGKLSSWRRHQMETFSALLALCVGNLRSPVNSPHKGQWRGASMFPLTFAWINAWVTNREAGDLWRHRAHHDVIVMYVSKTHITHIKQSVYIRYFLHALNENYCRADCILWYPFQAIHWEMRRIWCVICICENMPRHINSLLHQL